MPGMLLALVEPATTTATTTGSAWGWVGTALQLLWILFLFALVLFLAYVTTRVVGRRFGGGGSGRYLRIIDSVPLGQNRSLTLVEVSGEVYCVGVTEHGVTLIGKRERGSLVELEPQPDGQASVSTPFGGVLAGFGEAAQDALGRITGRFQRDRGTDNGASVGELEADQPVAGEGEFADRIREQIERLRKIGEQDKP